MFRLAHSLEAFVFKRKNFPFVPSQTQTFQIEYSARVFIKLKNCLLKFCRLIVKSSKTNISRVLLFAIILWSGGCSTSDVGSTDSTGSTENELSTFGLPATIAKLEIDTVDSTSMYFNAADDTDTGIDENADTETIGTLYWQHRDQECGSAALLASNIVIDVAESDPENDCISAIEIGSELADVDLALVNLGSGASVNDDGEISGYMSLPLGLVIRSPLPGVTDTYTLTIMNTFMSNKTDLSTGIAKDVFEKEMGFLVDANENESIAFVSGDADETLHLSTVSIMGGDTTDLLELSDLPLSIKNTIAEDDNGLLYLLDEAFNVFRIDTNGNTDELYIPNFLNSDAGRFSPHATGDYLVYTADAGNGYKGLGIFDVVNDIDLGVIPFSGPKRNYINIDADWADGNNLIITSTDQDGTKRLEKSHVSFFIDSGIEPALQTILTQDPTSEIFKPVFDNGVNRYTFFICNNSTTNFINYLCRYDGKGGSVTTVAEYDYDITNLVISKDGSSFVIFELASTPHYLCVHSISTEENTCISAGVNPVASNNKNNIVSFQGSLAGTPQVGIYNTDHNFILNPSPLEISPLARNVAAEASITMIGAGGIPPYDFSVTTGLGTISSLGLYTAPSSTNSSQLDQVTITDADGNTASTTLTIPAAGSLNINFGVNGIKNINVNNNTSGWDVLFESGNTIFVAGSVYNGKNTDLAVIKLNGTSGALDTSFGVDGIAMIDAASENDAAYGLAMQSDGKIIVVGEASKAGINRAVIARLTNDGDLDPTFGNSGITVTEIGYGTSSFRDVEILDDGNILACGWSFFAGNTGDDFLLARFNSLGILDTNFSSDGYTSTDFGNQADIARTMVVQEDGSIVVGGKGKIGALNLFGLARYLSTGETDTSFGVNGKLGTAVGTQFNEINKIILESDGDIVAAGVAQNKNSTHDFALARYNSNGTLDTDFSSDGYEKFDIPLLANSGAYALVKSNGKYLMGGYSSLNDSNFYMMRINTDGTVDESFGSSGIANTEITGHDEIHALFVPPGNNNIIAVGTTVSGLVSQITLAVYWP